MVSFETFDSGRSLQYLLRLTGWLPLKRLHRQPQQLHPPLHWARPIERPAQTIGVISGAEPRILTRMRVRLKDKTILGQTEEL